MGMAERLKEFDRKLHRKRALRKAIGISFILLGIAGIFLPILQGWIFLIAGLYFILGPEMMFLLLEKMDDRIKNKNSRVGAGIRKFREHLVEMQMR
jgi:uncharacterized membrane protein YbaN (DUF454 family)